MALAQHFMRSGCGSFIRSPNGHFGRMSAGGTYNAWGWRWRHILHAYWDVYAMGPHYFGSLSIPPFATVLAFVNNGMMYPDQMNDSGLILIEPPSSYGSADYRTWINTLRTNALLYAQHYLKTNYNLKPDITESELGTSQEKVYLGAKIADNSDYSDGSTNRMLLQISSDLGITIGGTNPITGLREWSNCKSDNSIDYKNSMSKVAGHLIQQKSILSNGEIAFYELELVYNYFKYYWTLPYGGTGIFKDSNVRYTRWQHSDSSSATSAYNSAISDSPDFVQAQEINLKYGTWDAVSRLSKSGSTYTATVSMMYPSTSFPTTPESPLTFEGSIRSGFDYNTERYYSRQKENKYYGFGFDWTSGATYDNFGTGISKGSWTVWGTNVSTSYYYHKRQSTPAMADIPAAGETKSRGIKAGIAIVSKVTFTSQPWLSYSLKLGDTCWFCSTTTMIVTYYPNNTVAYVAIGTANYTHQRPYGFNDWTNYLNNTTWKFKNLNKSTGTSEVKSYTNATGSLTVAVHSISGESELAFSIVPTAIPTADTLPSALAYGSMVYLTSNTLYEPIGNKTIAARCQVVASTITFNSTSFIKTVSDPASSDTLEVRSYTNYGRIKYTIDTVVGTFFTLSKASDDVAYTGANIKSDVVINYNSGLAPGTYNGSFRVVLTGSTPSTQTITIALTIV